MSRIKAGLDLAVEIKEEEQLEEIQTEPTEETVEEFQEESIEETIAAIDESFEQTVEGIWSDFKRDFLGSEQRGGNAAEYFRHLAQNYAKESSKAKDAHDMETALKYRDLSWYYSIMSGNPPGHIKDADQFKYDIKKKYGQEIKADLDKAQMNELKEPDYGDDDKDTYLRKLTPKNVKKQYKKTLPQGHTSLVDKYKLEAVENPKDKVTLDVPLLIRLLEYAREDAKTDMDLHDLTEKLVSMGSEQGKTLTMNDYDQLVSEKSSFEVKETAKSNFYDRKLAQLDQMHRDGVIPYEEYRQEIQNLKRYGKSEIDDFGVDDDVLSMNDFDGLYEDEPMEAKSNHAMKMAKSIGKMLKPVKKSEEEKADKEDKK